MWQHSLPDFYVPFQIHLVLSLGNAPVNFVLPCSDKSCRRKCHITAVFPPSCLCSICRFLWQFFKTKLLWDAVILHIDDVTWLTKPRLQKHCIDQIQVWELFPRYRMVRINQNTLIKPFYLFQVPSTDLASQLYRNEGRTTSFCTFSFVVIVTSQAFNTLLHH